MLLFHLIDISTTDGGWWWFSDLENIPLVVHDFVFKSHLFLSVPNLEEGIPGTGGNRHPVLSHAQAAHAVVVASEDACKLE